MAVAFDNDEEAVPRYFLTQGEVVGSQEPAVISTILGSCVAVCLFDRRRRIGAMNHYVLAKSKQGSRDLRYGDVAIPALVEKMAAYGSRASDLDAKIFGAAATSEGQATKVATSNVAIAIDSLHRLGIPVLAEATGGRTGRVIYMHTYSGEVFVRRLAG
ncbi:chemotaxis protein CheD [Lacibacterium aquatile]|uniref:Probable chemoreceptor glutamine deamidase CheD n=1 Tax=Lacibacterium aquatile TaxID=1168082 RepID=A0ABW5DV87_9PROT